MGRKTKRFIGEKNGFLEIIEVIHQGVTGKHVNVKVFCHNCKNESVKDSLVFKKSKSCGCDRKNVNEGKLRGPKTMPWQLGSGMASRNNIVSAYKIGAKKRGLPWELSNDECFVLFKQPCFYCGVCEYSLKKGIGKTSGDYTYNGIDRLDSSKGYSQENVVSCCWKCNNMKGSLSMLEFIKQVTSINKHIEFTK
jgi:hypothetical protein